MTIKAIGTSNKEISKIAFRELKTMKFVEHKNVIRLVDMFYRERLYLVSEMMDDNLNDLIRTKRFEEEKVKSLTYQIINGLNYLHSIGITHMVWIYFKELNFQCSIFVCRILNPHQYQSTKTMF